jgi:ribosomal protein L40E
MLMRLMPDGLARVSAVVICWKCSANNIVTIDESEFGRDEPAERIAVELPLAESAPAEPCFFCGNGLADTPTYSLEGRAGRLTICRRCAEQMALTDIPH